MTNFSATFKTTKNTIISASIVTLSLLSATSIAQAGEHGFSKYSLNSKSTSAQEEQPNSIVPRQKQCEAQANSAESIMRMYQNGTTIKELVQRTDESAHKIAEEYRYAAVALYKEVIYAAAMFPKYSTAAYQQNAVIEFSNKIMMECMTRKGS